MPFCFALVTQADFEKSLYCSSDLSLVMNCECDPEGWLSLKYFIILCSLRRFDVSLSLLSSCLLTRPCVKNSCLFCQMFVYKALTK